MTEFKSLKKPSLRGYFHQEAFFLGLGACIVLVSRSSSHVAFVASLIYSFGLLTLFGVSAIYHRPHWEPKPRALLRRFDHSAIFVAIAATFTPVCMLALPPAEGDHLFLVVWCAAFFGILQSIFWVKAPKWLTSIFYIAVGLLIYPYLSELGQSLGATIIVLIVVGGLFHMMGAVFYATKRPNPIPGVFGYHELFHIFTVIGVAFHFAVIDRLIR